MSKRKPKRIEFESQVWPISDNPLEMSRRLDFADWLCRNGHVERGEWMRRCCGEHESIRSLLASFTRVETSPKFVPADYLKHLAETWQEIRPEWWPDQAGDPFFHFGRIAFFMFSNVPWLYEGDWLLRAYEEGWLESIHWIPNDESALDAITRIPESHRCVSFCLDITGTQCERAPNRYMNSLLEFSGLHGMALSPSDLALTGVKRLSEVATNLRYLQLLSLRATNSSIQVMEQLQQLPHLRSLVIGTSHPDDQSIQLVAAASKLQFLAGQRHFVA